MDMQEVAPVLDGEEVADVDGGEHQVVNPATGSVIAREICCNAADVDRIVTSSSRAFDDPGWRNMAPAERGRLLLKLADLVERDSDKLVALELLDTGKPETQLRGGEIPLTASIIRFYAGAADKIEGSVKSTSGGGYHLMMYEPYGVVAGILPWNYPLVNVALKVAPALAAGNAIVMKPSIETPLTCVAFARLCVEAGFPPGIVNVVLGAGSTAGDTLVTHPEVKKISFTGSTAVGQSIQRKAVEGMKMVNLELGGKNAIVVFADADLERAAQAALFSAFVNAGQLCVSCSRLLVEDSIAPEFESMLADKLQHIMVGDPMDEKTLVGPMITRSQYDIALAYLTGAPGEGCSVLAGGGIPDMAGSLKEGFWIEPTLLTGVRPGMKVADEEIFGPVLSIMRFADEADAVRLSNSVVYGLSGSVWTRDGSKALRMVKALDTGILWINSMLTGYPQIPVPPHKMSGTGVELGIEGLLAYCKRKSAVLGYDDDEPVGWDLP
jgi:acyl-CoA reductase-like NAD-dependent aldehyde dehydrogenase